MTIDFYYHYLSAPSKTVLMVIKQLNLDNVNYILFENFFDKKNPNEELLKVNPVHQIPAIDDNGFHLAESCAIAQYLCDKYAPDNNLYPKDVQKRAQVNRMLFFGTGSFWPAMRAYVFPKLVIGVEPPKEAVDQLKEKISKLDTLIGNNEYVATDHLTIADLSFYSMREQIFSFAEAEKLDLNQFHNYKKWFDRITTEHPHLVEIASRMDGIDELLDKLKKNLNIK